MEDSSGLAKLAEAVPAVEEEEPTNGEPDASNSDNRETGGPGEAGEEEDNNASEEDEEEEDDEDGEETDRMDVEDGEIPKEVNRIMEQQPNDEQTGEEDDEEEGAVNEEEEKKVRTFLDEEAAKQAETTYSTRGRSADGTTSATSALDLLAESSHREADAQREKENASSIGPSFLSDSLTEEERRTRTRYLPSVDGMSMLRKQEIKGDLSLARCSTTNTGVASTVAKKVKNAREDDMDVDESVDPSDDDRASEILRLGTRTIDVGDLEYNLPTSAFVAPEGIATNGDSSSSLRAKHTPPTEVETVTAFNPPRPPESVGAKKKHRMLRWERRPADIEADLNTYRKTVKKTREELKKAMAERDRMEMMDNHVRRHFLNHLECMNQEFHQVVEETSKVQQECVSAADLLTSRTRSRGAGKSSYVMRDVLAVLQARGAEMQEKGLPLDQAATSTSAPSEKPKGIGGVGCKSFERWDKTKTVEPQPVCAGWVVPGDKVKTPYGDGVVIKVLGCSKPDPAEKPPEGLLGDLLSSNKSEKGKEEDAMDIEPTEEQQGGPSAVNKKEEKSSGGTDLDLLIAPRVAVKFSYGVGFFPADAVEALEDPACFSDSRLAIRWKGLMETSALFGDTLDVEAMADYIPSKAVSEDPTPPLDGGVPGTGGVMDAEALDSSRRARLLPFGSDLVPTSVGRGAFVAQTNMVELDEALDKILFQGSSVLGVRGNIGVPDGVQTLEEKHSKRIVMKARLSQLQNEVDRQRRIRQLNQRTFTATQERSARIESLVNEMRTDLKSLKRKLDEEVQSLGIDDQEAEKILLAYYNRDDTGDGDISPFKRSRTNTEIDVETEDDDDGVDEALPSMV